MNSKQTQKHRGELRRCRVSVYLYEDEKELVAANAEIVGLDSSAYLRNLGLGRKLVPAPPPDYMRINERLGRIADACMDSNAKEEILNLLDLIRFQMKNGQDSAEDGSHRH